jgi:hypothetical protein
MLKLPIQTLKAFKIRFKVIRYGICSIIPTPFPMNEHIQTMELITINALLVEKNRAFARAMKAGRPHRELVEIYNEVKEIYNSIAEFTNLRKSVA